MSTANPKRRNKGPISLGYRKPIALRLSEKDEAAVRRIAQQQVTNPTQICRLAVREYLASHAQAAE